jgi:hypothetical protein
MTSLSVALFLCVFVLTGFAQQPTYLVGDVPGATHYAPKNSDIHGIVQPLLNGGNVKVIIAPGLYLSSFQFVLYNNTHLTGYGMDVSILKLNDWAPKFNISGFVRTALTTNITVSHLTLDGNKYHQYISNDTTIEHKASQEYGRYGLFTEGSMHVTFDSVHVTDFQAYGFDPHGRKSLGIWGDPLTIKNCKSSFNDWDGFTLDQSLNIYVVNSTSFENGRHGFNVVTGSRYTIIENCTSIDDGHYFPTGSGCGIMIQNNQNFGTHSAIFRDNIIVNAKKAGICTNGVYNVSMVNNIVQSRTCVRIERTNNTVVQDTICVNSPRRITVDTLSMNISLMNTVYTSVHPHLVTLIPTEFTIGYSNQATFKITESTNTHASFQHALDTLKIRGGGILRIEAGLYLLSSFIEIGANTSMIGAGMNNTILRLVNNAAPWWREGTGFRRSGFVRAVRQDNLVFAHFTLDGNRVNQKNDTYSSYGRYGFYTEVCANVFVNSLGVINFQGYGFDPHGFKRTLEYGKNLTIVNSHATNNAWDGYTIDQSIGVLLHNNTSTGNGRHGYNIVTGTKNITLANNTASGNGHWYFTGSRGCGMMIQNNLDFDTRGVAITGNTIVNSSDAGVCMNEVDDLVVMDNLVDLSSTRTCMRLRNVTFAEVINNRCVRATRGITVTTSTNVTLLNNVIVPITGRKMLGFF